MISLLRGSRSFGNPDGVGCPDLGRVRLVSFRTLSEWAPDFDSKFQIGGTSVAFSLLLEQHPLSIRGGSGGIFAWVRSARKESRTAKLVVPVTEYSQTIRNVCSIGKLTLPLAPKEGGRGLTSPIQNLLADSRTRPTEIGTLFTSGWSCNTMKETRGFRRVVPFCTGNFSCPTIEELVLPPPGPLPRYFQRHKAIVTRPRVTVIERAATASLASDLDCKWELPTTGALERPTSLNTESLTVQVILLPHRSTGQTFPDPIPPLSCLNASANSPGWRHIEDLDVFHLPGNSAPTTFLSFGRLAGINSN